MYPAIVLFFALLILLFSDCFMCCEIKLMNAMLTFLRTAIFSIGVLKAQEQ